MEPTHADFSERPAREQSVHTAPGARPSSLHVLQRLAGNAAVTGLVGGGHVPHLDAAQIPQRPPAPPPAPPVAAAPPALPPVQRPEAPEAPGPLPRPPHPTPATVDDSGLVEARQAEASAAEQESQARGEFEAATGDARSAMASAGDDTVPQAASPGAQILVEAITQAGAAGAGRLTAAASTAVDAITGTAGAAASDVDATARQHGVGIAEQAGQAREQVTAAARARSGEVGETAATAREEVAQWRHAETERVRTDVTARTGEIRTAGTEARAQVADGTETAVRDTATTLSSGADRAARPGAGGSEPVAKGQGEVAAKVSQDAGDQMNRAAGNAGGQLRTRAAESDREIASGTDRMAEQVAAELPAATTAITGAAADTDRETTRSAGEATGQIDRHGAHAATALSQAGQTATAAARARAGQDRTRIHQAATASVSAVGARATQAATQARAQVAEAAGQAATLPADEQAAGAAVGEVDAVIGEGFDTAAAGLADTGGRVGQDLTGAAGQSRAALDQIADRTRGHLTEATSGTVADLAEGAGKVTGGIRTGVSGAITAGSAAVAGAGQQLSAAAAQAQTGLAGAAATARQGLAAPVEETRQNTETALAGVSTRIATGQQRVADRGASVQRTTQRFVQRSILGDIGDWFSRQWDDIKDMLGNWGFWAGLLVTLLLFPVLGPGALVVGGAVGGAVSGIQQNVQQGRSWYDLRNIGRGALVGALIGGAFAAGSALLVLGGLEGAALLVGEMVLAGGIGAVVNLINGDPWDKGLLGNILLVGLFRGLGKAFPRVFGGARGGPRAGEEAPAPGARPGERAPAEPAADGEGCFVPGTLVATPDGPVGIERIAVGDKVLGGLPGAGPGPQTVTAVMTHVVPRVLDLTVAGRVISCTPAHPFWVDGPGWTPAGELTPGTVLTTVDGRTATVTRTRARTDGQWIVHNLTVAGTHTFYVAESGVLVHNKPRRYRPPSGDVEAARAGELAELENVKARARRVREAAEAQPEETPGRDDTIRQARDIEAEARELQTDANSAQDVGDVQGVARSRGELEASLDTLESRAPARTEPEQPSRSGTEVAETFDTVEAAIGQVEGNARVVQTVRTANEGLRSQGFTETVYVVDNNGTQWTVSRNPRTGRYATGHHSSSN
ncbi:polymorphic toxin-type HINT domain-containing protein [Phytomonospora endophytica]|uniref:Hint domain-containing protein n=1 Tax=Phytomonospora endophytica TaxID=714109 RepID=A0A841FP33_9ACTN|nr:polymorphic toxin-type HINT domain-containing protein [Phytomonospora endophytica]MBB6037865.1 hypothetical protein [Phytomonospora endophytica]GIG68764.1 hypothetical protein Pen01_50590 [Phytomonospora endophytica]